MSISDNAKHRKQEPVIPLFTTGFGFSSIAAEVIDGVDLTEKRADRRYFAE